MEINGKKLTAWVTGFGIILGFLAFIGIRGGDFFVPVSEGVAVEAKLVTLEREFEEYKKSHDRWAEVQIKNFEQRMANLKEENIRLETRIDKMEDKLDRILSTRSGPFYPK